LWDVDALTFSRRWPSCPSLFVFCLTFSKQIPGQRLKLGHDHFSHIKSYLPSPSLTKQHLQSHVLPQDILADSIRFPLFIFRNNNFLSSKVVSLASNPQPGGPGPCICPPVTRWPSYAPRDRVPFSSPSTTLSATVEVL
jgi:hypothetical protein